MQEILENPFFRGLVIGLAIGAIWVLWVWISAMIRRSQQRKEMIARMQLVTDELEKLRQHLHTQMQITAKGTEEQQKQLEALREQNENLRVMVQGLQQKPDNARLRTLEVWQRAIERMNSRAPGFAAAWQQSVAEAETEVAESEGGLTRFVRRFLGGAKPPAGAAAQALPLEQGEPARDEKGGVAGA